MSLYDRTSGRAGRGAASVGLDGATCAGSVRWAIVTSAPPLLDARDEARLPRGALAFVGHLPSLVGEYLPGAAFTSRQREQVLAAAAEGAGALRFAHLHHTWATFLGAHEGDDSSRSLIDQARHVASGGGLAPADSEPGDSLDLLDERARRSIDAVVALASRVGRIEAAIGRLGRLRPSRSLVHPTWWRSVVADALVVGAAIPAALPLVAWNRALEQCNKAIGPLPDVQVDDPDDLFLDVVATALSGQLRSTPGRALVLHLPVELVFGLVDADKAATVRIGCGALAVERGISPDAVVVLDGDLGPLMATTSDVLLGELRTLLTP